MTRYTVIAERSGDWWALRVKDIRGVHSQARTLAQAPAMAQEAIALALDVDPSEVDVHIEADLPRELRAAIESSRALARQVTRMQAAAAALNRQVVESLTSELDLTQADAARILDLSPQRLSQLASDTRAHQEKIDLPADVVASFGTFTSWATSSTAARPPKAADFFLRWLAHGLDPVDVSDAVAAKR